MDSDQAAVLRLRADGLSYRQIAAQLGIPLTRAYKLGTAPAEPEDDSGGALFGCAVVCSDELEPAPKAPPPEPEPAPAAPPPGGIPDSLPGTFRMPTTEDVRRGYTMPGPGGTVYVITPGR